MSVGTNKCAYRNVSIMKGVSLNTYNDYKKSNILIDINNLDFLEYNVKKN